MSSSFDLAAYLARVRFDRPPHADLETLARLHRAHVEAIPFENLEIQMGGAVRLEPDALQAKMVARRRGGYCFEQNALFALALQAVGFDPLTCEARVRQGAAGAMRPRTHMILVVPLDGRHWLADVGFGGDGLAEPLALDGEPRVQVGRRYRVVEDGSLRVLQAERDRRWEDLYAFAPSPVFPVDFVMANWFTSTFPTSPFVTSLTAQRTIGDDRHILRNLTYTVSRGDESRTREIAREDLVPLLRDVFDLDIPADARFRALDTPRG